MTTTATTDTAPRFTGRNGDRNYRAWLNDDAAYRIRQARAEANASQDLLAAALERAGELFLAGDWDGARRVLRLAMED